MAKRTRPDTWLVSAVLAGSLTIASSAFAADPSKAACLSASAEWANSREAHKLRAARDQLLVCAAASCPADIREECSRHIPEVSAAIPSIVFAARDGSSNDVTAVTVRMDGQPLLTKLDGTSIAIDPGEHTFRFEALGQAPVEKKFVIQEGEKERRERIQFGPGAPLGGGAPPLPSTTSNPPGGTAAPLQPAVPGQETGATVQATEAPTGPGLGSQKILGLVAGGVGVAGVAVGSIFGVMASSKWSSAKSDCGSGCAANSPAQAEKSDASNAATVATIGFVAGGALVATGLVLFFTAPKSSTTETGMLRVVPTVGPGAAGVTVAGKF